HGRAALASATLPKLEIVSPRGDVVLPFGEHTEDVRLAPRAALVGGAGAPVAALAGAGGDAPVAWTQVRGRTNAGNAVDVDGSAAAVGADGSFGLELPLHVGENDIVVVARDDNGFSSRATLAVAVADRDSAGTAVVAVQGTPELSLYLPPQGVALK